MLRPNMSTSDFIANSFLQPQHRQHGNQKEPEQPVEVYAKQTQIGLRVLNIDPLDVLRINDGFVWSKHRFESRVHLLAGDEALPAARLNTFVNGMPINP